MRICVVDDDPKMVTFMTAVLEDAGHTVISNVSPMMAIPDIIKNAPDCLVTDLVMAELDGVELCHHLRGRDEAKDLAIIFVTAQRSSYWQKKAIDAGADGYIVKPLDPETFAAEIERLVNEKPASNA
ncbi:MAG: response regulator [Alphaproteobacteria bacterium]|jgi:two-component system, cell cycle response regulator DivK|nr:response regulator [Alphaproteobacteria bacterium]MBT7941724.1 response regulator [Alphaproteobacteria bacterium]